jgi:hypothetical protein
MKTQDNNGKIYLEPKFEHCASYYKKAYYKQFKDGEIRFYSYDTLICVVKGNEIRFTSYWDYSATTLRHLKEFLSQFTDLKRPSKDDIRKYIQENDAYRSCYEW